jgi:hypothetical protein
LRNVRSALFGGCLSALVGLAAMSIVGAFLSLHNAHQLFTSRPMTAFWIASVFLLACSVVAQIFSRDVLRSLGPIAMHTGIILILIGAMLGSGQGHRLAERYLGIGRLAQGYLRIVEGRQSSVMIDENGVPIGRLPFAVGLSKFETDYYPPKPGAWELVVRWADDAGFQQTRSLDWLPGMPIQLPGTANKLTVLQYLPRARAVYPESQSANSQTPRPTAIPDAASSKPAMELAITDPAGGQSRHWLIVPADADCNWIGTPSLSLWLVPQQAVQQYRSKVTIIRPSLPTLDADIEVNHPLSIAGYSLHQNSFRVIAESSFVSGASEDEAGKDDEAGDAVASSMQSDAAGRRHSQHGTKKTFGNRSRQSPQGMQTTLAVHSELGLSVVYAGLALLVAGAFVFYWGGPIVQFIRRPRPN